LTADAGRLAGFDADAATGVEAASAAPHDSMQSAALSARVKRRVKGRIEPRKDGKTRAMLRTESRYDVNDTSRGRYTGAQVERSGTGWPGRLGWFIACLSKADYY
jgi:hypothetical protein